MKSVTPECPYTVRTHSCFARLRRAAPGQVQVNTVPAETTWWLDDGALPDRLIWARLVVAADDSAVVFDCDGRYHHFSSSQAARYWLEEDEYVLLAHLIEDGEVPPDLAPPAASNDTALVELMLRPNVSVD